MAVTSLKRTRAKAKGWRIKKDISADLLWERPADWPQLPVVLSSDSKFVGLYKVEDHSMNHVALKMTIPSGTYSVDWGDGTTTTGAVSGTTASHTYDYSDTDLTLTSEGFKVAVVVVTPDTAVNFNAIDLNMKNSNFGSNTNTSSGWLEMRMSMPGIVSSGSFTIGNGSSWVHRNVRNFEYVGACGVTNGTNMFVGYASLEQLKVSRSFTTACTTASSMFSGLARLKYLPDLDLSNITTFSSCFSGCTQLRRVPELNIPACTSIALMFSNCSSLEYIPDMTTGALTAMNSTFSSCTSLKVAPAISNTATVATTSNMFLNCVSMKSVPVYNLAAATNIAAMFSGCSCLEIVPALNFAAVNSSANFNNVFLSCHSLRKILATGARFGHTLYGQLGATELDLYYTNIGTASGAQTLTVSGNFVATDTPAIATAKGWTVSGS